MVSKFWVTSPIHKISLSLSLSLSLTHTHTSTHGSACLLGLNVSLFIIHNSQRRTGSHKWSMLFSSDLAKIHAGQYAVGFSSVRLFFSLFAGKGTASDVFSYLVSVPGLYTAALIKLMDQVQHIFFFCFLFEQVSLRWSWKVYWIRFNPLGTTYNEKYVLK